MFTILKLAFAPPYGCVRINSKYAPLRPATSPVRRFTKQTFHETSLLRNNEFPHQKRLNWLLCGDRLGGRGMPEIWGRHGVHLSPNRYHRYRKFPQTIFKEANMLPTTHTTLIRTTCEIIFSLVAILLVSSCSDDKDKATYEIGESCEDDLNFHGCNASGRSQVKCNSETRLIEETNTCGDTSICTTARYSNGTSAAACLPDSLKCDSPYQTASICTRGLTELSQLSDKQVLPYYEILNTGECVPADDGNNYIANPSPKICSGRCSKDGCEVKPCSETDEPACTEDGLAMNCFVFSDGTSQWAARDCVALGGECTIHMGEATCVKN